jgi:hypothetical protein
MPFVKLDCDIIKSSLWVESDDVRLVFLTMLAMANSEGLVPATAPGIALSANLRGGLPAVRRALKKLEAPDRESKSRVARGRRVKRVDGGYLIINYLAYRDKDYTAAERQRRWRERQKKLQTTPKKPAKRPVTRNDRNVTRDVTRDDRDVTPLRNPLRNISRSRSRSVVDKPEIEIAAAARAHARVRRGSSSSPPHGDNGNEPIVRDNVGGEDDRRYIWHHACELSVKVHMPTPKACRLLTTIKSGKTRGHPGYENAFDPAMSNAHAKASADLAEQVCAEILAGAETPKSESEQQKRLAARIKLRRSIVEQNPKATRERIDELIRQAQNDSESEEPWRES